MDLWSKLTVISLLVSLLSLPSIDGDGVRLPDQVSQQQVQQQFIQQQQQLQLPVSPAEPEGRRQGKGFLDLIGLGTGPDTDPYVARTNGNCLTGDLSECFKTHALSTFDEFFVKDVYHLTDGVRVVRMPQAQLQSLYQEPYEFSGEPRSTDSEWDQLVKYALRRVEKFIKSAAFEMRIPEELTEGGRYSPRFVDDIADEIDVIEDKKAPHYSRFKLKKLFIPLLLVLKLFKLKLLLFLPFILGLLSFKKFLALAALVVPGVIAYFKLCRPQTYPGAAGGGSFFGNGGFAQYSPQGVGAASYHEHFHNGNQFYRQEPAFAKPYTDYYSKSATENGIRFGDHAQDLSYQGYGQYRNNEKQVN